MVYQMKNNEKLNRIRPLKIWEILQRETDEDHPIGTEELRARLLECGIEAHRTTIYEDIRLLNECGYEVMSRRGRSNQYYVVDRSFSNPEIHILLDAVQAASFITEKKTGELVDKIAQLAGSQKGLVLKSNIVQFNTAKSSNESIYYNVNEIVSAITKHQKIIFLYFDYDTNHNRVYRRDGHHYVVSPFATVFADGHYYLVIYDKRYNKMTNYRIDRMERVEIIDELADTPPDELTFDIANYKKSLFGMFAGKTTKVSIEADHTLVDAVFDLFGEKTKILSSGDKSIRFSADVQISPLFFGWCCSFGDKLRVLAPESVKEELKEYTALVGGQY
ncbi:MAG: WYL domain-containing transcriptional regulator [Clostridia bacterium]|nr:WYL domain-containing transcriptional regulator [Clostridia bacterium]